MIRYKVYITIMVMTSVVLLVVASLLFYWSYPLVGLFCLLFILFPISFIYRAKRLNELAAAQGIPLSYVSYSRLTIGQAYEED